MYVRCVQVKDLTMDGRETHSVFQLVKDNTLVEYQVGLQEI